MPDLRRGYFSAHPEVALCSFRINQRRLQEIRGKSEEIHFQRRIIFQWQARDGNILSHSIGVKCEWKQKTVIFNAYSTIEPTSVR